MLKKLLLVLLLLPLAAAANGPQKFFTPRFAVGPVLGAHYVYRWVPDRPDYYDNSKIEPAFSYGVWFRRRYVRFGLSGSVQYIKFQESEEFSTCAGSVGAGGGFTDLFRYSMEYSFVNARLMFTHRRFLRDFGFIPQIGLSGRFNIDSEHVKEEGETFCSAESYRAENRFYKNFGADLHFGLEYRGLITRRFGYRVMAIWNQQLTAQFKDEDVIKQRNGSLGIEGGVFIPIRKRRRSRDAEPE
ncbi:hypothetical protein [Sanyastnella coralliicola]|uniref:hypothetical protein n=1 Tax=Sanyastnella coralliicola TaxID=3069118 RepID=UPI0027B8B60F|nr:hypothetical protein [Longitalea sp. SCSIO 12813]